MNESNPYATPQADQAIETLSLAALGELVKSWEKMRLLYNGALLVPGIVTVAMPVVKGMTDAAAAAGIALICGLAANASFFLGPLAELYIRGIFFRGEPAPLLRKALLIGGFVVSFGAMGVFALAAMFA